MTTHCMLDIETMGTGSYAAIVSIGAVKFDPNLDGFLNHAFSQGVSLASSMKAGLRVDADTINWWLRQDRAAVDAATIQIAVDLDEALLGFAQWYGEDDSIPVWGNGAGFDNVILGNAYKAVGLDQPWSYKADRCFRTLRSLAPAVPRPEHGVAHNALDDAIAQAKWLQAIVAVKGWML